MDKSEETIKAKAKSLNIKLKKAGHKKWTDESIEELKNAMEIFCLCVKISSIEKILRESI